jgi:hypothetical protein
LVRSEGWVRPEGSLRLRGLSPAMRLAMQADALVAAPHPNPLPSERAFTPVFDGLCGKREQTEPVAPASLDNATIGRLEAAVREELARVETMRASLGSEPQRPVDAERTARTLSVLTETMAKLRRLRLGSAPQSGSIENDNDYPADIDAFRREFARRLEAFVASRTGGGGAGGAGPAGRSDPV